MVGPQGGVLEKGSTINCISHKRVAKRDNVRCRGWRKVDYVCDKIMLFRAGRPFYLFRAPRELVSLCICCPCVGVWLCVFFWVSTSCSKTYGEVSHEIASEV